MLHQKGAKALMKRKQQEKGGESLEEDAEWIDGRNCQEVLSPTFLALMNEHYDVAAWLIRAEERRLMATDKAEILRVMKTSLIHLAAMVDDQLQVIPLLLSEPGQANVNSQDEEGNTPLHLAYQVGNMEVVRVLEDAGCNRELLNHKGLTPAQTHSHFGVSDESDDKGSESETEDTDQEVESSVEEDSNEDGQDPTEEGLNEATQETEGQFRLERLPSEIIIMVPWYSVQRLPAHFDN